MQEDGGQNQEVALPDRLKRTLLFKVNDIVRCEVTRGLKGAWASRMFNDPHRGCATSQAGHLGMLLQRCLLVRSISEWLGEQPSRRTFCNCTRWAEYMNHKRPMHLGRGQCMLEHAGTA